MMGQAVVEGLINKKLFEPNQIIVTAKHQKSLDKLSQSGTILTTDNLAAARDADLVIVSVHPHQLIPVLKQIAPALRQEQMLISMVTGISISAISDAVEKRVSVVRTAPNIAAISGASMTAICAGPLVTDEQKEYAATLFESIGEVVVLDERHLNAATGLAGCGPAFAFKVIESLAQGGIKMGLPRDVSIKMAAQVLKGAGEMVLKTGRHPAYLKDAVSSPGGCTIDGLARLEEGGLPIALIKAVETSTLKAGLLYSDGNE